MSLNVRITIGAAAAMVVACIAAVAVGLFNTANTADMYLRISSGNMNAVVQSHFEASVDKMEAASRTIGREREAIAALVAGDGAALDAALMPVYNRLSANGDIHALLVYDAKGSPAVRFAAMPSADGTPVLALRALESKKRESGYLRLGDGSVGYGFGFPLLQGRDVVGVGILAIDLAETLAALGASIDSEVILTVDGTQTAATESAPALPLPELRLDARSAVVPTATGSFMVAATPIADPAGERCGHERDDGAARVGGPAVLDALVCRGPPGRHADPARERPPQRPAGVLTRHSVTLWPGHRDGRR